MLNRSLNINRSIAKKKLNLLPDVSVSANYLGAFQGALTTNAITLSVKLNTTSSAVKVYYSKNSDLSNSLVSTTATTDSNGWCKINLTALDNNSTYYWSIANDDKRSSVVGKFKTLNNTYTDFKIVVSSCAYSNSNSTVFTNVKNENALIFQHMGDIHYADIAVNDVNLYRTEYERLFTLSNQKALYENVPLSYIWDDHDFGENNSSADSVSKVAARSAYRSYIPSYNLPSTGAIYYSYVVGNILFVVTDNRSERSNKSATDDTNKTVLGTEQKQWFKDILLAAKGVYRGIVWYNSFPWLGSIFADDEWSFYQTERTELSSYIKTNEIPLLAIVNGDAHMIAIDNGSGNEIFGVPSFQFAALDQTGTTKGSGYSHGTFPNGSQYGILEFTTNNRYIELVGTGKNSNNEVISRHKTYATKWIAFNDCYGRSTGFSRVTNTTYALSGSAITNNLINYKTGNNTNVTITNTISGTGYVINTTSSTANFTHLTEVYDRFKAILNTLYSATEVTAASLFTITLSNLDTTKYYLIECASNRGDVNYTNQRGVTVTVNNYTEIVNLSTTGTITNSVNSISYASGHNTVNGYVVRWIIKPSSTTVTINSNYDSVNYPTGNKGYPVQQLCVAELI